MHRMDIKSLQSFLQVARARSFSKASALLGVTQPALSRQMRRLEEEVGQSLLHRDGRGISLTEAGRMFMVRARAIVEEMQVAKSELANLRGEPRGTVTLGLSPTMCQALLPAIVRQIRNAYPRIHLRVMQGLSGELNDWLVQGRLDAAVLSQTPATRQRHGEVLAVEDLYLIGPGSERTAQDCTLAELAKFELVLPTSGHGLRTSVEDAARQAGVDLRVVLEIDSLTALVRIAQEGIAHAVLPKYVVAAELRAGAVCARRIVEPPIRRTLMLATATPKLLSPAAQAVVKVIRESGRGLEPGKKRRRDR
jgi:LysR family transcriptional regulator, nitrogen assimilation regulatory protein